VHPATGRRARVNLFSVAHAAPLPIRRSPNGSAIKVVHFHVQYFTVNENVSVNREFVQRIIVKHLYCA